MNDQNNLIDGNITNTVGQPRNKTIVCSNDRSNNLTPLSIIKEKAIRFNYHEIF